MPKRPFTFDQVVNGSKSLKDNGWQAKEMKEVYQFTHAISPWVSVLNSWYGDIKSMEHLSNPDDPPDIMIQCEKCVVGFEITEMTPQGIGKFNNSTIKKIDPTVCTVVPNLSTASLDDDKEMIKYATQYSDKAWANIDDEIDKWSDVALDAFSKKVAISKKKPSVNFIVLWDSHGLTDTELLGVAKKMDIHIQKKKNPIPKLIIHSPTNNLKYLSFLICLGQAPLRKTTSPIPINSLNGTFLEMIDACLRPVK